METKLKVEGTNVELTTEEMRVIVARREEAARVKALRDDDKVKRFEARMEVLKRVEVYKQKAAMDFFAALQAAAPGRFRDDSVTTEHEHQCISDYGSEPLASDKTTETNYRFTLTGVKGEFGSVMVYVDERYEKNGARSYVMRVTGFACDVLNRSYSNPKNLVRKIDEQLSILKEKRERTATALEVRDVVVDLLRSRYPEATVNKSTSYVKDPYHRTNLVEVKTISVEFSNGSWVTLQATAGSDPSAPALKVINTGFGAKEGFGVISLFAATSKAEEVK